MSDMEMKGRHLAGTNSWADTDLLLNPDDKILFRKIGEFVRAEADIEEIKNDPFYDHISNSVRAMIKNRETDNLKRKNDRNYILESLRHKHEDDIIEKEIRGIRRESRTAGIDKITSEWVDEWNENSERVPDKSGNRKEIREFVTGSLKNKKISEEHEKVFTLRWILATAAVIAGTIFFIKSLLLSDDPNRIFARYYEPMNIISYVTRGANAIETDSYALAVESYKAHNYQEAAAGFSMAAEQDSQSGPARFFLGLSQIGMENYREAVAALESVVTGEGEYVKDATWYLGLAYIKTGETGKARICFETLSRTPGFYRDRSAKILRRLK